MILICVSGHSGAGKSRLLAAAKASGLAYRRHVIYTSRSPREGETDGVDYHFRPREIIERFPTNRFIVEPVRGMLQAVDLAALEIDLRSSRMVIVELFHTLWPRVQVAITTQVGITLRTLSVFLTAVALRSLENASDEAVRATVVAAVEGILTWRGKDNLASEIRRRADSAGEEVLGVLRNKGAYDRVLVSAPEGPEGDDEWTREAQPIGRAAEALREFLSMAETARRHG